MGLGVTPVCLEHLEILFAVLNRANSTYMAATSDFFGKFEPFAKSLQIIIFHAWEAFWSSQEAKMGLRGKSCSKIQGAIWVLGSNPFVWDFSKHFFLDRTSQI